MNEEIRVLKTATCPSLSGKSILTYQIGCNGSREVYFRIVENSGAGLFSKHWSALEDINQILPADKPITSGSLQPIFKGMSANSVGFTLALLKNEGLIIITDEKKRVYGRNDQTEFDTRIKALMDVDTPPSKPAKVTKKESPPLDSQEISA